VVRDQVAGRVTMTVSMSFGFPYAEDGATHALWEGVPEDDGCGDRPFAGTPHRVMSTFEFQDWLDHNPKFEQFLRDEVGWCWPYGGLAELTFEMACRIAALPVGQRDADKGRYRWLKYWAERAREEYSDDAILAVSGG